jgi:hypothetical protein
MHLGKATGDCTPVQVDEDIWTQVAVHGPGNSGSGPKIINRTIIYRLHPPEGADFLVVLNAMWIDESKNEPIAGIEALAKELGIEVAFILTPDSGHHLSLDGYAKAFPKARVCIPAGRIERENAELLALPNVETYPMDAPPAELAAAGLEIMCWQGLAEGPTVKKFMRLQFRFGYELGDLQAQIFCHLPSGTITNGGHNLWYRHDEDPVFEMPAFMAWMMRMMVGLDFAYMQPGKLNVDPSGGVSIVDKAKVQASAQTVLDWEFDKMIDIHSKQDGLLGEGARAVVEEALGPIARGEWDKVVWHQA